MGMGSGWDKMMREVSRARKSAGCAGCGTTSFFPPSGIGILKLELQKAVQST